MSFGISAGTAAIAGATLASGYMGAQAAGNAADAQAGAAAQSNATQRYIFDQQRQDNAPFLRNGVAGNNRLAYLLGLSADPGTPGSSVNAPDRAQIQAQFEQERLGNGTDVAYSRLNGADQAAYQQEVDRRYAAAMNQYQNGLWQAMQGNANADPAFGSLTKPITRADIESDPTYAMGLEFGLNEGTKGINRQAAATGGLLSGATLKALTKYGNDYATQKAGDAVNRIGAQRQQQYSMLSGISGGGQAASGQTGAAAQNFGNNVSQTAVGLGNARAASAIGGANAWTSAINGGMGAYQGNQLLQTLQKSGGYGGTGYGGSIDPWNGNVYQQNGSGGGW